MILRAIIIIEQFKLLEVVEPGGSKYGINDGKVTRTVVAPTDGESTDRALVASQSAEDGGHIHSHCTAIDPGLEIERCRAPERAPPPREHLCAGGILAREDGDDADEDIVREAAYQVFSSSRCQFWLMDSSSSLRFLALVTTPICLTPPASLPINKIPVPKSRIFLQN